METTVKERPILFKGEMVLALLNGSKTQTRRVVKNAPDGLIECHYNGGQLAIASGTEGGCTCELPKCPYGKPGDRLWVRETLYWDKCGEEWCYQAGNGPVMLEEYTAPILLKEKPAIPSIHMPREASRILLEIVAVRVERLNDISEADAVAEGVESCIADLAHFGARARGMKLYRDYDRKENSLTASRATGFSIAVPSYGTLWESINGPGSWDANPWVWVVTFKQVQPC